MHAGSPPPRGNEGDRAPHAPLRRHRRGRVRRLAEAERAKGTVVSFLTVFCPVPIFFNERIFTIKRKGGAC